MIFPHDVPGWLSIEDGQTLAGLATGKAVLEIGSYCGRSTICMAQTAYVVYSVDWHQGGPEIQGHGNTEQRLRENLGRYNAENVLVHVQRIEDFAERYPPIFDLIFIDGDHDRASVQRDTLIARRLLVSGGVIAWHDFERPEVRQAILDLGITPEGETLGVWRSA